SCTGGGMVAGLPWLSIATEDRILRKIAFGFFVIAVPLAGCVHGSQDRHALKERRRSVLPLNEHP
ncbi:MAG: hypothetical protein WCB57_10710, partial [Pseudonocardiaceae bacterium]